MGLIKEDDRIAVLTDILGVEDHLGDMDFKVTGTRDGITAFQMDTKIAGISREIMTQALTDAQERAQHILDEMHEAMPAPRAEMSQYAPKIDTVQIPVKQDRRADRPGRQGHQEDPGGDRRHHRGGRRRAWSSSPRPTRRSGAAAMAYIRGLMAEPEVGKIYKGVVKTIVDFGAFVEYLPGKDGLLHISELEHFRVGNVEDVLQVGDELEVKLVEIDSRTGKVRLSRKALLPVPEGMENMPRDDRPRDRDRDGGGRGGDAGRRTGADAAAAAAAAGASGGR